MATASVPRQTLGVLVLSLAPALAWAAPTPADTPPNGTPAAEKVRQQLDQPVTLDIADQSLNAALAQLRELTKLNFVVDRFTMQQMGFDPEQLRVSANLKDVKAKTALRSLLAPYNLGYAILGDTVLVSTDDVAMTRQLKQRVSVDVDKLDVAAALKKLSKETAANVTLDSRVQAKQAQTEVSLQLDDVPLENAVRLIAETAGLKPVKVGNVLLVTTKALAAEMRNDPELIEPNNKQQDVEQMRLQKMLQMQQMQMNQAIWLNGNIQFAGWGGIGINGMPGQPIQPGALPVPPLEKPGDRDDEPSADGERKPDPVKPPAK